MLMRYRKHPEILAFSHSFQPTIFTQGDISIPLPQNYITHESPQVKLMCLPEAGSGVSLLPLVLMGRLHPVIHQYTLHLRGPMTPGRRETHSSSLRRMYSMNGSSMVPGEWVVLVLPGFPAEFNSPSSILERDLLTCEEVE